MENQKTGSTKEPLNFSVLGTVGKVAEKLKGSKCKPQKTKEFAANVSLLNGYFDTTDYETWMLCVIINHYFENREEASSFTNLASFFDCPVLCLHVYRAEFESLLKKHYISNKASLDETEVGKKNEFMLSGELLSCVIKNRPLSLPEYTPVKKTVLDMIRCIGSMVDEQSTADDSHIDLRYDTLQLEEHFAELSSTTRLLAELNGSDLCERIFLYDCCYDFITGGQTAVNITIQKVFCSNERICVARSFLDESNKLFKRGLLEFTEKGNLTDAKLTITQKTKELLFEEDADLYAGLYAKSVKGMNVIRPEEITEKHLFYSDENEREIARLSDFLQEEKLLQIREKLSEKGLPKGIAVLLYGAPGTGKTETVYQIAKVTGRKIFHVDISEAKSCWFGESEKQIKEIFTGYRNLCKSGGKGNGERLPILLFNEADGILSKRREVGFSNTAQTENAMQNIILEEMERLDGIMIATTNLADNLDAAFERRFLFKVKFENPSVEAKEKIWRSKASWLSDGEIAAFARDYDLSGAQIDNIVRKATMDEVLTGSRPDAAEMERLCRGEKISGGGRKIGFF